MKNRRADKRLLLPDIQISVKRSERKSAFILCTAIDVSFNGLAFSSNELKLDALEKIDFQLTIGHRNLCGQGVICDISNGPNGKRYGVLFISMEPAIEEICNLNALSSNYVRELAVTMADHAIASQSMNDDERELNKAWAMLHEGIDVFRQRLCEQHNDATALHELFIVNAPQRKITLPLLNSDQDHVEMTSVSPQLDAHTKRVYLQLSNGRELNNIMELLQDLSEAFSYIFTHESNVKSA